MSDGTSKTVVVLATMCLAALTLLPQTASAAKPKQLEQKITLTVDDKAWANVVTGRATVTGEVTCAQPTEVYIDLNVVQRKSGDKKESGYGGTSLDCNGTKEWSALVGGDFFEGEAGIDAAAYDEDYENKATASIIGMIRECTLIGTLEDDYLEGTGKDDKICGLSGDDVLVGKGGDDELRGHDGDDRTEGGGGNDLLTGGSGADVLTGQGGNDRLYGDEGPDDLDGGRGKDGCRGEGGNNRYKSCEKRI